MAPPPLAARAALPVMPGGCDTLCLMGRSLVAVLGGWLAIQFLILASDALLLRVIPGQHETGLPAPEWMMGLRLGCAVVFSVGGGWLAARLAPERPWRHAVYLIVLGETLGVVMAGASLGAVPLWYFGALLLLFPPAVLAGAWLRLRRGPGSTGG